MPREKWDAAPLTCGRSGMKIARVAHQVGDLADDIATKINAMADQVAEDARSGPVVPESPGQRPLGMRGVISQEPNIDGGDSPDAAVGDQLTSQLDGGRVPVVEPSRGLHACSTDGVSNVGRFACVAARRLLHPDVLSCFSRGDRDIAVDEVRASDTDQVKVIALDQLVPVVVNRGEAECRHCVHQPVIRSVVGDGHQDRLEG